MNRSRMEPQESDSGAAAKVRVIRSEELLMGRREVIIEHGSDRYRLLITRSGKLVLNK